jgi:hypothetical protein
VIEIEESGGGGSLLRNCSLTQFPC